MRSAAARVVDAGVDGLTEGQERQLLALPVRRAIEYWDALEEEGRKSGKLPQVVRMLARADLYYLLVRVCGRVDMLPCVGREGFRDNEFAFERCREVQGNPNGYLDLWSREHWKTSILTFGLTLHDILCDPEVTIGIFSHTRPIAKAFLRQIMRELETNRTLHAAFPDILWGENVKASPKWALDINTPVLTVDGWKRHGDLVPGDRIFGSDGNVITVTGNSGVMHGAQCMRVVLDDCEFIASADHLWPVDCRTIAGAKWDRAKRRVLHTKQLRRTKNMRMLATPVLVPPESYSPLPLSPYLLGLWLGDGTSGTNIISMHRDDEPEILSQIGEHYVHRRKPQDNFSMYGVRGLKERLDALGCLRRKYIPQPYLMSCIGDRLALLQGLMDSDGTCKKQSNARTGGMCMFSNTNADLANGVLYLAASLGLRPSIISFQPKSRGRKIVHHVYFVGLKQMPPFRLSRKLERCKDKRTKDGRYIRSITPATSVPVNCIKVDAKDSLYLAGERLVPTHNSEDDGIIVKRKSNPNEATVEAWGLVDGQPTSKHFKVLHYDDVVVAGSVTTPDMIAKVMQEMERSYNLGTTPGIKRAAGTRWHFNDAYRTVVDRQTFKAREYPGRVGGTEEGESIVWSDETHRKKRAEMGPYTYAAQILLNPKADSAQGFRREWLKHYERIIPEELNWYLLWDAASSKKKGSDFTAGWAVGLGKDGNFYCVPICRDRLNLKERSDRVFEAHRKYKPLDVRYEKYGLMADVEHLQDRMGKENYHFPITEVGGQTSKADRIKRLIPLFEAGRVWLPRSMHVTDWQKNTVDLVRAFIEEEYMAFPAGLHDDMLDALSRIIEPELKLVWPLNEFLDSVYKVDPPVFAD